MTVALDDDESAPCNECAALVKACADDDEVANVAC